MESQVLEPPAEMKIGLKYQVVKEMWDEITVFDQWEGNNFWLSYWQVLKIEGSRNRDSTLDHFKHFHCKP